MQDTHAICEAAICYTGNILDKSRKKYSLPLDPDQGLFDAARYTGGGGAETANLTTRMRRYPREVDGQPVEHLALTDKDKQPDYLITPDKVMKVQLVA